MAASDEPGDYLPEPSEAQRRAFGARVRSLRKVAGLTQEVLAERMPPSERVSGAAIGYWEKGTHPPRSLRKVLALEVALEEPRGSLVELLGWEIPSRLPSGLESPNPGAMWQQQVERRLTRIESLVMQLSAAIAELDDGAESDDAGEPEPPKRARRARTQPLRDAPSPRRAKPR